MLPTARRIARRLGRFVTSSPLFDPNGLFSAGQRGAWYDIQDLSTMRQGRDGTGAAAIDSPVGTLYDKSGNGFHAVSPSDGARPTLRQDGSGRYYLDFDGFDDCFWVNTAGRLMGRNVPAICVFTSARFGNVASATSTNIFTIQRSTDNFTRFVFGYNATGNIQIGARRLDADAFYTITSQAFGDDFVGSALIDYANRTGELRRNGLREGTFRTDVQSGGNTADTTPLGVGIGSQGDNASSSFLFGRIYELLILNYVPTATQRAALENRMMSFLGIAAPAVVPPDWVTCWNNSVPVIDLDFENDRFWLAGTEYDTIAALTTAGYVVRNDATAQILALPTTLAGPWFARMDHTTPTGANNVVTTSRSYWMLYKDTDWNGTSSVASSSIPDNANSSRFYDGVNHPVTFGSRVGGVEQTAGTTWLRPHNNGSRNRVAYRHALNDQRYQVATNGQTDTSAALLPALNRLLLKNRSELDRTYPLEGEAMHRITFWPGVANDAALNRLV